MHETTSKSETALREERILQYWESAQVLAKVFAKPATRGEFVFYEGPPTANGAPGIHHLEARGFKDAILRYKTMRGFHVRRKAGWDTHGLPVELEVERELGFSGKKDIEAYGIAAFNERCRKSVLRYIDLWKRFTERIAYWVDQTDAYFTCDTSYIESVWAILKKLADDGRLYKDYKILPWCARCGTALSSHELAQGYEEVKDLSVYFKFPVKGRDKVYLLAWTTAPWTIPAHMALAVGADIDYSEVKVENGEIYIIATSRLPALADIRYEVVTQYKGERLIGTAYDAPYDFMDRLLPAAQRTMHERSYRVYGADFVTTEDGTGIVHTGVMYGADDFSLAVREGLPRFHVVEPNGHYRDDLDFLAGRFVKDEETNLAIVKDLAARGLVIRKERYPHSYPFCWRCRTPLIYYARDSWFIRMSDLRDTLLAQNGTINWEPPHIRDGRMGEWLSGIKDWAISRERYWGTPLPVWESDDGSERRVVGSVAELEANLAPHSSLPRSEEGDLDLHRPYVDDVVLLGKNGARLRRVKEVIDVWFDSGAMPFAQDHYPFEKKEWIDGEGYPADFICEAIDQTRGWFYTLLAIGALMGRGAAYKNAICLGHVVDAHGKKMSKSGGNAVDPWEAIDRYGVDALRFWMFSVNQAGDSKSFDAKATREATRTLAWLDNSVMFYELFARDAQAADEQVIDRWMRTEADAAVADVTAALDAYRTQEAARRVGKLLENLSQWYVRRIRERVRDGDGAALETLRHALRACALLLAPLAPFLAEDVWLRVRREGDADSVHLADWPTSEITDRSLLFQMETVRSLASEALMLRQKAGVKVRQPLSSLSIAGRLPEELAVLLAEEVNVKEIVQETGHMSLDTSLTPELVNEGDQRELQRAVAEARKALGFSIRDKAELIMKDDGTYSVEVSTGIVRFDLTKKPGI